MILLCVRPRCLCIRLEKARDFFGEYEGTMFVRLNIPWPQLKSFERLHITHQRGQRTLHSELLDYSRSNSNFVSMGETRGKILNVQFSAPKTLIADLCGDRGYRFLCVRGMFEMQVVSIIDRDERPSIAAFLSTICTAHFKQLDSDRSSLRPIRFLSICASTIRKQFKFQVTQNERDVRPAPSESRMSSAEIRIVVLGSEFNGYRWNSIKVLVGEREIGRSDKTVKGTELKWVNRKPNSQMRKTTLKIIDLVHQEKGCYMKYI